MSQISARPEPHKPYERPMFDRFHARTVAVGGRNQNRRVRPTVLLPGTIRRTWHNHAGYTNAHGSKDFSFTANDFSNEPMRPKAIVSTPFRYLITTMLTLTAGNQRSRPMMRPAIPPVVTHSPPRLVMAGNVGYRPTVRSRVPSFGSRVPALNPSLYPEQQ